MGTINIPNITTHVSAMCVEYYKILTVFDIVLFIVYFLIAAYVIIFQERKMYKMEQELMSINNNISRCNKCMKNVINEDNNSNGSCNSIVKKSLPHIFLL